MNEYYDSMSDEEIITAIRECANAVRVLREHGWDSRDNYGLRLLEFEWDNLEEEKIERGIKE